jgi:hypothetical protein
VDDVVTTLSSTQSTGRSCYVVAGSKAHTAPERTRQGTGLSFAAMSVTPLQVAFGARVIDLPGLPPRGAPV